MFSFSAHLLLHPSCKLATTNPKPTQDASYECQPILIPTVWTHGQLRALHYYVRLMPRPIDHHAKQFRPHACPYIPHRLVFQAPKLVSPAAHGRFRRPGACRSVGVSPRVLLQFSDRGGQLWADPVACALIRGRRSTRNAISCPRMPSDRQLQGGHRPERGRSSTVVGRETLPWPAGAGPQGFEVGRDAGRPQALASPLIMHLLLVPSQAPFPPYNRLRRKNPGDRSGYQRGWRIIIFLFHFLLNFR